MKTETKNALLQLAKGKGIDPSQYESDKDLFQYVTGINVADDEFVEDAVEWYVPGGACVDSSESQSEEETTTPKSADFNEDGKVDSDDITLIENAVTEFANQETTEERKAELLEKYDIVNDDPENPTLDSKDVEAAESQMTINPTPDPTPEP